MVLTIVRFQGLLSRPWNEIGVSAKFSSEADLKYNIKPDLVLALTPTASCKQTVSVEAKSFLLSLGYGCPMLHCMLKSLYLPFKRFLLTC